MRNKMTKRLQDLEERSKPEELGPMIWMRHDQTPDEARAEAGLAPGAPCVFFKWGAPQ